MIEVNNLVKRYGNHTAVDHLSFKIEKGKIYGFLGPNGAGKSTTMNMITGYIASTEGTVKIDGHDILEEPEAAKKCIGYLPEQPPVYFDMTVLEYMKFVANLKKIPKDKKANMIEEVMDMVKISDMRNRLIKNLSKGYRQRVGLAEAIMGYPEVIILDEPFSGLDPVNSQVLKDVISEQIEQGRLVIFSSHQMNYVEEFCNEIAILNQGKIVLSGNIRDIKRGYERNRLLVSTRQTEAIRQWAASLPTELIKQVDDKDGDLLITLAAVDQKDAFLTALTGQGFDLDGFQVYEPSLNDIFVSYTEGAV